MTETNVATASPSDPAGSLPPASDSKFTEAALERHKREGMELAVKARWIALSVFAVMLPFINPRFEVIYYEGLLAGFALIGWAQRKAGRVGRSRAELLLILCDLSLMTIAIVVPNPLASNDWPLAMEYRSQGFMYFYVFLATGTLAYSWRTVRGIGSVATILWLSALAIVWFVSTPDLALTDAVNTAFGAGGEMARLLDPNSLLFDIRIQEVVVFLIVAMTLAVAVRRYGELLRGHAALERERANLARYFSPNVVEEL